MEYSEFELAQDRSGVTETNAMKKLNIPFDSACSADEIDVLI